MRLKQVMVTLINNSLKYSKGKPVNIYAAYDRNEHRLQVKVVDYGKGLNAAEFAQLTKVLQSLGNANTSENEATGNLHTGSGDLHPKNKFVISTRLSISKQIVEKCGG